MYIYIYTYTNITLYIYIYIYIYICICLQRLRSTDDGSLQKREAQVVDICTGVIYLYMYYE